ncbi:MAG: translation initiation factor, partial [Pseudomonadota bacterium]
MDKVKIQEIADEAGLSNGDLLEKAKELGFDVKAANSTISMENAGILVDYAISGVLPKGFKKPTKPKAKTEKKKEPTSEILVHEEGTSEVTTPLVEEVISDPSITVEKPIKKRKGISVVSKEEESSDEDSLQLKRKTLSRDGIKIVRKAQPIIEKASKNISMEEQTAYVSKKKTKKVAEARDTGTKIDIFNYESMSEDIDSGFGGEEVVLLDFSDKNIYEDMMRQEQKRKEEAKKREDAMGAAMRGKPAFRQQQQRSLKRGGKRKKYDKVENTEVVTSVEIPENVRVYEFAEKVNRSVGEVIGVLFQLGMMVTKNDFLSKDEIEILAEEFEVEVTTINP